jgi:hypothetical protein
MASSLEARKENNTASGLNEGGKPL